MSTPQVDPRILWARTLRRTVRTYSGCWIFTGATISTGYGCIGNGARGGNMLAHRLAVIVRDGSIPDGMTVDHDCHDSYVCREKPCPHRRCVNPDHLQVLTMAENIGRQWDRDTCRKGHKFITRSNGARRCPECASEYAAQWRKERAA